MVLVAERFKPRILEPGCLDEIERSGVVGRSGPLVLDILHVRSTVLEGNAEEQLKECHHGTVMAACCRQFMLSTKQVTTSYNHVPSGKHV